MGTLLSPNTSQVNISAALSGVKRCSEGLPAHRWNGRLNNGSIMAVVRLFDLPKGLFTARYITHTVYCFALHRHGILGVFLNFST